MCLLSAVMPLWAKMAGMCGGQFWGGGVQTVLYVGQCCCFISLTLSFSAIKYPSLLCSMLCLCLCVCVFACMCMYAFVCVCVHLWVGGWVVKG